MKITAGSRMSSTVEPAVTLKSVSSVNNGLPSSTDHSPSTAAAAAVKSKRSSSIISHASTVSFHSVDYFVPVAKPGRRCCCGTVDKQILHNISGIFKPGMNAIMGPTGSGKTTLLDVIAGRTETTGIRGHILVDGHRPPKNFKCMTGYVVQDDVVMGTLTIRENFMFSANLRLSNKISYEEKCQKVNDTIQELGLTACADSKVGTEIIRGVSGGERKRTNIGMELIISPPVLFLDEPTTGLDSSTAFAVLSLLHRLSRRGRTIIFSIHQPRYTIFKLFDRLSLLASGRTVYHGLAAEALDYFQSVGYECEAHNNPPDFFLDIINGDSSAVKANAGEEYDNSSTEILSVVTNSRPLAEELADKFAASQWATRVEDELKPILSDYEEKKQNGTSHDVIGVHYTTSFLTQLRYVSKRTILNLIRNPQASVLQIFIAIFFAVIVGIIFLQLDDSYPAGLQNRVGSLFFIILNQTMSNLSGVELFIKERVIFVHESASGFYRVSTYFFSKIFCDFIPMRLVPLCLFAVISYFMIGFKLAVDPFFFFLLTLFLTTMCASAVCFAVSASVNIFAIANLLSVFIFVLMMIFGGLFVNIAELGDWLRWLQYLSFIRYSLNALSINELHDMTFYKRNDNGTVLLTVHGADYLTEQGIKHDTAWDLWQNIMAMGIMAVGLMIIAYIQLRRMKKLK